MLQLSQLQNFALGYVSVFWARGREQHGRGSKCPGRSVARLHWQRDQLQAFFQPNYSPAYSTDIFNSTLISSITQVLEEIKPRQCEPPGCSGHCALVPRAFIEHCELACPVSQFKVSRENWCER